MQVLRVKLRPQCCARQGQANPSSGEIEGKRDRPARPGLASENPHQTQLKIHQLTRAMLLIDLET